MKSPSSGAPSGVPTKGDKVKIYLIAILVIFVLGVVLYFAGLLAGKAQLAAQAAKFGVERNGLQSQVKTAETARDAALDRSAMMEARSALYRTAIDLDARNFGTANNHLKEAATALASVKGSDTSALKGEIGATDLNVAVNLADQRQKVLGFAEQLNKMMPAPIAAPNSTITSASSPDAVPASPATDAPATDAPSTP